ncbi:DUF502 domain-containing protein [Paucibacter sp. JuS9]|uniref:DUF502 domain-containing protein n=1 Tax=Roseateles TaxID=93681 RepID=UPI002FE61565
MRKYLITGLLAWLPLAITVWVLLWALSIVNGVFAWMLKASKAVLPDTLASHVDQLGTIPGVGPLILVLLMTLTGVLVANIFGQWLLGQWDRLLSNIPIVKSIYSSVKQVSDTLFSSSGNAFREAVLVPYPHQGAWTIGFVTGAPSRAAAEHFNEEHVSLYVPTTPNPTSGFFLMMPKSSLRPLGMSVDEALKHIISMGVVAPASETAGAQVPPGSNCEPNPKG